MIFQEPVTALRSGLHHRPPDRRDDQAPHRQVATPTPGSARTELLELVRIPSPAQRLKAYPHEMSGGMRQRAMIALALSCNPSLLLADEPTTALDATVQIQVLLLIRELQRELDIGVIFVTHDIGVAVEVSDRIGVMYAGKLVELGGVEQMVDAPQHPYTPRPARLDGAWRHARPAARGDPRRAARSRRAAARLQLRAALQVRRGPSARQRRPTCARRATAIWCAACWRLRRWGRATSVARHSLPTRSDNLPGSAAGRVSTRGEQNVAPFETREKRRPCATATLVSRRHSGAWLADAGAM